MATVTNTEKNDGASRSKTGGIDAFIHGVSELAWMDHVCEANASHVVQEVADRYTYIRLGDIRSPRRFLQQMAGAPPVRIGQKGFRADLIDDYNPARHYAAFLFVGYYLWVWLAVIVLVLWEAAGFVRYRGAWSWPDIRSGIIGIQHGRLVRSYGTAILPGLIAADLADPGIREDC